MVQDAGVRASWPTVRLGEAVQVNPPRPLKRGADAPFVAMGDLLEDHRLLPAVDTREFKGGGSRFRNGDTLLARITPSLENGKTAWVSGLADGTTGHGSTEFIVMSARDGLTDPRFVYYLARSPEFRRYAIGQMTGTSGRQRVPADAVEGFEFPLPPLEEQRAIARVLGALDDKIELNRRTSETLEEMARALFRSWFVDFDPVRAKAEGRPSGLPPDLDALFPASFEGSELGEIPVGWEVRTLGDAFELAVGGAWGKDARDEKATQPVNCLRGIDCHALAEDLIPEAPVRWLTARQLATRKPPTGSILIEGSGSFCGRSLLWSDQMSAFFDRPVTYSNFVKRLDRTTCSVSQATVIWQFLRSAYRDGEIQLYRTGTAFPNLDAHSLLSTLRVVVPPEAVAELYVRSCATDSRIERAQQSRSLSRLRDVLLPQLVSGELRLRS